MPIGSDRVRRSLLLWLLLAVLAATAAGSEAVGDGATPESGAGALYLHGAPEGRPVWVSGRYAGLLPLRVDSLTPGRVLVEVGAAPSSRAWEPALQLRALVRAGAVDTVRVGVPSRELVFDPGASGREASPWADLRRGTSPSRWPAMLPVAAIALGAAGVWSRHAADQSYGDYERTLNRDSMDRYLDRARRLDRVAVACWIGAETCLVTAAWLLLRAGPEIPVEVEREDGALRLGIDLPAALGVTDDRRRPTSGEESR